MLNTAVQRGHAAMLLFSLLVAGSFSFGARIANLIDPVALMTLRFIIAGCVVGSIAFALGKMKRVHFQAPWRYLIAGGIFSLYFVFMFEGLKTASAISTAAIFTLTPILSAFFGYILLRQITTRWMALALTVGACGALWVVFEGSLDALLRFDVGRGEIIYFIGCIAHGIYPPLARMLNRGEPGATFTFGMIIGGLILLLIFSGRDLVAIEYASFPKFFWFTLLYLSLAASSITFFLLQYSSMTLPSANVMAYTYLTPTWVIGIEILMTGNVPSLTIWFGIGATIVALLMLLRRENGPEI